MMKRSVPSLHLACLFLFMAAETLVAAPPDPPLVAINTWHQRVQVSWSRPAGAVSFNLYYAKAPNYDNWRGASMGTKTRAGLDLPVGASYAVVLSALNAEGEESELADPVFFDITDTGDTTDDRDPVIYFATSESDAELFRDVGISITLESSERAIYAFDVNAGSLTEVKKINSPGYASSTIRTLTMDDRVFITRYWSGTENYDVEEYVSGGFSQEILVDAVRDCLAVVDDAVYFNESQGEDLFGNPVGEGGFRELRLPDTSGGSRDVKGNVVFAEGFDDERCNYNMTSSRGVIYDGAWDDDGLITLVRRDPQSLAREDYTFDFREADANSGFSVRYLFGFHDGRGYFVRSRDDGVMQVWEYVFGEASARMIYLVDDGVFGTAPFYLDAAGEYLLLGNSEGFALLIDRRKGTRRYFEVGSYYDLELFVP